METKELQQKIINEKTAISISVLTIIISGVSFVTAIHARADKHEDDINRLLDTDKYLMENLHREMSSINSKLSRIEERLRIDENDKTRERHQ